MKKIILLIISLIISLQVVAQEVDSTTIEGKFAAYSQLLSPEKVYLHTDREVYCVGDTIWFKGYLKNNSLSSEFAESNYIYVELFSPLVKMLLNGKTENIDGIRSRVKIKRMNNTFSGYMKIPEKLNTGIAVLRAYTYWMMNREPEYMFTKNIELRNPMKDDFVKTLKEDKVYDKQKYLEIGAENPFQKVKDPKYDIDIQFMPESGRYVVGENSMIAFKAIDNKGNGVKVRGSVYISPTDSLTFESNHLGMGLINLKVQTIPEKFEAQIYGPQNFSKRVEFPKPEEQAVVINVKSDTSYVLADVYSKNITSNSPLWFVIHDGTEIYVKAPYNLSAKRFKLEHSLLSNGINNAAVVDDNGNVYASRAFFVYPKDEPVATFKTDKEIYKGKEKVLCDINLKDKNGNPLSGNFSISVSDDEYSPYSSTGNSIVSYMLLSSEIKGFVEHPQEYFNREIPLMERIKNIDLLMLSQGWKYYDLPKILTHSTETPRMGREYTQSISGKVMGFFKVAKKSIVSFLAPSINFTAVGQLDTSGWFALNGLDFPDSTKFIVSASNTKGVSKRFTPRLDEDVFAANHSYHRYLASSGYSVKYKQEALSDYYNSGGELIYTLKPVYITALKDKEMSNISPMPQHEFKSDQYRSREELEPYKDYDLMSYIVTTCPPLRFDHSCTTILCRTGGVSSGMSISGGWSPIIIFINGMRGTFNDLQGLTVDDLDAFAYVKGADAAKFDINNQNNLTPKSVVMISTKWVYRQAPNVTDIIPLGWQKPKKMYSPRYESELSKRGKEAMRCTVHWQPNLNVVNGRGKSLFYTSSHPSDYTVILEGLTTDNRPVFMKTKIKRTTASPTQ